MVEGLITLGLLAAIPVGVAVGMPTNTRGKILYGLGTLISMIALGVLVLWIIEIT